MKKKNLAVKVATLTMASIMMFNSSTVSSYAATSLTTIQKVSDSLCIRQQGMCIDYAGNIYYARISASGDHQKIFKRSTSGNIELIYSGKALDHANDMTYYGGHLYVATGNKKVKVLDLNGNICGTHKFDHNVSGIAYDKTRGVFYIKIKDTVRVCLGPSTGFTVIARQDISKDEGSWQGIATDGTYLYAPVWASGGVSYIYKYEIGNSYKFNRASKKAYECSKSASKFEIEALDFTPSGKLRYISEGGDNDYILKK